jgi:hypothetical protein
MIEWFAWLQIGIATVAGLSSVIAGLLGRAPNDAIMASAVLVELLLIVQIVVSIVAPAVGNAPTGSALEYWVYLATAALIPPLAVLWGLLERKKWSTVVIGVGALAVAVMLYRMREIWFIQTA